jgi:hypothetical protein
VVTIPINYRVGIDDVIGAMKTGNATQVKKVLIQILEISVNDKSNTRQKPGRVESQKDFTTNMVKSFFDVDS